MITEIALIDVKPGMEAEFEAGVKKAAPVFKRAKGCRGLELRRSIEKPARYRLFVEWETIENHTVDFRGSPDFQEWRKLVAHCFAVAARGRARDAGIPRVLKFTRAPFPHWRYAPARRIRGGRLRRARQCRRGSLHAMDWRSTAGCGFCRSFGRSPIPARD